jgi:hypothetical protein
MKIRNSFYARSIIPFPGKKGKREKKKDSLTKCIGSISPRLRRGDIAHTANNTVKQKRCHDR